MNRARAGIGLPALVSRSLPSRARGAIALAVVAIVVAGCGASGTPAPSTTGPRTGVPDASLGLATTDSQLPAPTLVPAPTVAPTLTSSGAATPGPAAGCSGSAANREFFTQVATAVSWDVYCAVLPAGWFVRAGSYRLGSGGRLDVTYAGPDGATLELIEGNFCSGDTAACVPAGQDLGPASFGDRSGVLFAHGDGLLLSVAAGQAPSWQAIGTGLDADAFKALCAALVHVPA